MPNPISNAQTLNPKPDVNPQPSTLNLANGIMHKCESDHAITARNACLELPAYTTL